MKENIEIKKSTLYMLGIIAIVIFAGFFILRNGENSNKEIAGNVAAANEGEIQKVVIGLKNYNYYPNTIKVKVNQPVSISLDKTVSGCLRDFTIRDFGIRKYLKTPEDTVEFTPNTKGNQPVSISLDKTVSGCLRDFTIRDFGIRKYLKTPEDTVEFTPNKKGTYTFACSMGMGTGTVIVE